MHSSLQLIKVLTKVCTCPLTIALNMHKKDNIFLRWHLYVHIPCIAYLMRWKQSLKKGSLLYDFQHRKVRRLETWRWQNFAWLGWWLEWTNWELWKIYCTASRLPNKVFRCLGYDIKNGRHSFTFQNNVHVNFLVLLHCSFYMTRHPGGEAKRCI